MMYYDPARHHRRSIRLKGYDYSQPGRYFLTVNVKNGRQLFGHVINGKMILNDAGKMVETWYFELENKYPNIVLRQHVVMPNHFHTIIEIMDIPLYGHLCVDAQTTTNPQSNTINHNTDAHVGTSPRGRSQRGHPYGSNNKKYHASIFDMMDWFKTMTTNAYILGVKNNNWPRFDGKLWQPRYHDHIIRNNAAYHRIKKYIIENPTNWKSI
ncbi:MAG: transposase [Candidatus Marinimicrobia bacterium]|nr:transposase [Candidatus Neomarinimicrobiota bacterium]